MKWGSSYKKIWIGKIKEIKHKKNSETIIKYRIIKQWYQNNIVINDRLGIEETEKRKQKKTK